MSDEHSDALVFFGGTGDLAWGPAETQRVTPPGGREVPMVNSGTRSAHG